MPREYAKNWFSMWTDEDFCNQPVFDKLLYQVLLGQPPTMLSYAGVQTLNFKRWRKAMRDGDRLPSAREVKAALLRMERRRNVFTDDDTDECLIRSFIRRDEVHKQPNVLLSALRAAQVVESPKLCAVLLDELKNRVEIPEIKIEGSKNPDAARRLRDTLDHTYAVTIAYLQSRTEGLREPLPEPFREDFPEGLPEPFPRPGEIEPFPEPFPEGLGEPPVVVEVEVPISSPVDKNLRDTRAPANNDTPTDVEPPARCKKHRHIPPGQFIEDNCGPCANFDRGHKAWAERHTQAALQRRADFWNEVRPANCCDPNGMTELGNALVRCPNHNWAQLDD